MKILIISGKQGAGKTTISNEIAKAHNGEVEQVKFADVIYEMHNAVVRILDDYWPPRSIEKDGPLLQLLGTEWGRRTIDENIWVKILQKRILDFRGEYPEREAYRDLLVIIDDCRFENEFDAFPNALRVRLCCDNAIRKARCSMWRDNDTHPSETGLDKYSQTEKFDLYLNTDEHDVNYCVTTILARLDKVEKGLK